jgi:hypothetical protein
LEVLANEGVGVVVYPSHRVSEALVAALRRYARETGRNQIPPTIIPVHYLGRHSQTSIRIPSLTYDRIKESLRGSINKKALILDDAAVTGKAQREFEQLLRNAGAEDVFVLAVLSRTGLPLYRNYLVSQYAHKNRYYWRWDVPTLGTGRHCPLCRAIGLADSLKDSVFLSECSAEVTAWINTWSQVPVDTHWERRGLVPGQLPRRREISFGKEWVPHGGAPVPYKLSHRTTTALAATVAELIRVTAYKDVGLKISRNPSGKKLDADPPFASWRRATAEILLVQTLLFLEDFELGELESRMGDLVELLLDIQEHPDPTDPLVVPTEIQQLICLTLLLAPREIAPSLLDRILARAGAVRNASTAVYVAVGVVLRSVPNLQWDELVQRINTGTSSADAKKRSLAFLSRAYATVAKKTRGATSQSCLVLFLVLGTSDRDSHSGLLRRLLLAKQSSSSGAVLRDLHLAVEGLELLPAALFQGSAGEPKTQRVIRMLRAAIESLERDSKESTWDSLCGQAFDRIRESLYQPHDGWVEIRDQLAPEVGGLVKYLKRSPSESDWTEYLEQRARSSHVTPGRWWVSGKVQMPQTVVGYDEELDLKRRIFCPPLALRMIHDYLLNVVHATRSKATGNDLECHLAPSDLGVTLSITNRFTPPVGRPQPKLSELLLSSLTQLLNVAILCDEGQRTMKVTIHIPYVHSVWNEVTK